MNTPELNKTFSLKTECRRKLALPCVKAIAFGLLSQLIMLGCFIFLVNFDILHPIRWLLQLFGFHWLKHVPLFCVLLANGLSLCKTFFTLNKYHSNRFKWLLDNGLRKLVLLTLQILLGLLSAWSFLSYLRSADGSLFVEIDGNICLNSHYTFLSFIGLAAGVYQFLRSYAGQDVALELEDIPKPTYIRLREILLKNVKSSAKDAIVPTISFVVFYWLCGGYINYRLAYLFNVAVDGKLFLFFSIITNIKALLYAWILVTEIFTVMNLMLQSFSIFITNDCEFPIGKSSLSSTQLTLAGALSMQDIPTVQKLAALDFYNLTKQQSKQRRREIFALSQPGGHPYNWNQLSSQCLSIINAYIADLNSSIKSTPGLAQSSLSFTPSFNNFQPNTDELAQRILIHQYNEKHNIRRLKSDLHAADSNFNQLPTSTVARINANFEQTVQKIKKFIIDVFKSVPGLYYMFGEQENAKTTYLLSHSDIIIWIVQGLASVCASSISDDPYGIIQLTLPEIVKAFLKLKIELDKLSSLSLSSKKADPNLMPLRNALKRSLHLVCNAFAEYLPEICEDSNDLPLLRTFLYQTQKVLN